MFYPLKKYFGITEHPVFMDDHFQGYNHIIKVEVLVNGKYKNIGSSTSLSEQRRSAI